MQIVSVQDEPTRLFAEKPTIEVLHDCVFAPIRGSDEHGHNFWVNHHWGVYDRDGRLVPGAAFSYLPNLEISGQNEICLHNTKDLPYAPAQQYFYVGNLMNHYGHFLCSSMARFWALPEINLKRVPLLGHSEGPPHHWFTHYKFFSPLFNAAGVGVGDFAHFDRPVRIRELIVAHPAMVERNFIHKTFAHTMNELGDRLAKSQPALFKRDIIYISKTQHELNPYGISNEAEIVAHMHAQGVLVAHPEQLPLAEQISLFRSARCIIGQCGSALHTMIFTRREPDQSMISILNKPMSYSSNHAMLDIANEAKTTYVYFPGEYHSRDADTHVLKLQDPTLAAAELLALARA